MSLSAFVTQGEVGNALPQYSPGLIACIWATAALPMAAVGWVASPLLARPIDDATGVPGTTRVLLMTLGLTWQFVLRYSGNRLTGGQPNMSVQGAQVHAGVQRRHLIGVAIEHLRPDHRRLEQTVAGQTRLR